MPKFLQFLSIGGAVSPQSLSPAAFSKFDLIRKGNHCKKALDAKPWEDLFYRPAAEVRLQHLKPINLVFALISLSAVAYAQSSSGILVGIVASKTKTAANEYPDRAKSKFGSANEVEARVFEMMNARRLLAGLCPLVWSDEVAVIARLHSQNMATGKFFSHRDLDGGFVDDRAARFGILDWIAIGENIAFVKGFADPAVTAVEHWMNSPSHKQNVLSQRWRQTAVGVAVAEDGAIYFTQVFIER
ncbi:MAG: hypothetical protein C4325_06615 [Blastocatellia bacterium]